MEPENAFLEEVNHHPNHAFQVLSQSSGNDTSFAITLVNLGCNGNSFKDFYFHPCLVK